MTVGAQPPRFAVDRTVFGLNWNQAGMIRGDAVVTATLRFNRAAG